MSRTFTNGGLTIVAPNYNTYLKEANILHVTESTDNVSFNNMVTLTIDADLELIGGVTADYVLADGEADIDLQDVLNIAKSNAQLTPKVTISNNIGESIEIEFLLAGYARPILEIVPTHAPAGVYDAIEAYTGVQGIYIPPSYMLNPLTGLQVQAPICYKALTAVQDGGGTYSAGDLVRRLCYLQAGTRYFFKAQGVELFGISLKPLVTDACGGVRYCALKWVDRLTGLNKCFTWEMEGATYTTGDVTAIMRLDKEFESRKNESAGFTARLRNLNIYDFNYYADIVTADMVEATTDGIEWKKCYIDTDSATLLDGNAEKQDLVINVIFVRNEY